MGWLLPATTLLCFSLFVSGLPLPQGTGPGTTSHGQPQAGSPSTPGPASGGTNTVGVGSVTGTGTGTGTATGYNSQKSGRARGYRDWRHGDPLLIKGLWTSKGPLDSLGNAEVYIVLALLIGFLTVVVGCWLSDNCWSPEPEGGGIPLA